MSTIDKTDSTEERNSISARIRRVRKAVVRKQPLSDRIALVRQKAAAAKKNSGPMTVQVQNDPEKGIQVRINENS